MERTDENAKALRAQGLTYDEIGKRLGVCNAVAWKMCNRERDRKNSAESNARYRKRGCIALADMPEHRRVQW